jgi:hypothetical protein
MPSPKVLSSTIELTREIDPSVAKVVGLSVKELYKINQAYNTIAKLQKQANLNANGLPPVHQKTTVEISRTNRAAQESGNSFKRISEVASGIGIADIFVSGLERAADLVKEMARGMISFGKEASNAARDYEMRMRGMAGVLQGNKPLAEALMARDAQMAILSPFQGQDLQGLTSELLSSGGSVNQAKWLTKKGGDLVAGAGGNAESLDRFANAMSETKTSTAEPQPARHTSISISMRSTEPRYTAS